jgi:4-phospho-D-threonate 3-dehydrogenase / 4-phospho-D-erythronate 3-dehydrogenase
MENDTRPLVALTMGDPAGIGPEICARALADEDLRGKARCVVYGDARVLRKAAALVGVDQAEWGDARIVDLANADPSSFEPGKVSGLCGRAAWEYVEAAAQSALAGVANRAGVAAGKAALFETSGRDYVRAVVTAPINKESVSAARVPYIGHTEMLGAVSGTADPLTMFETLGLRSFFLTRHVSLRKACDLVTRDRLLDYIERCSAALAGLGAKGELAVAGLNPHCGEHGLFGDEEGREVEPAVAAARAMGIAVAGPIGADSVFHLAKIGRYAAVLSLYHDQGHIACKTLDFERTVSLTLGMPFLRTSVDHGTAFDIAWTGKASAISMVEAVLAAAKYAPTYAPRG